MSAGRECPDRVQRPREKMSRSLENTGCQVSADRPEDRPRTDREQTEDRPEYRPRTDGVQSSEKKGPEPRNFMVRDNIYFRDDNIYFRDDRRFRET